MRHLHPAVFTDEYSAMDGSDRNTCSTFWMPNPYQSIVINWASYRDAAIGQGRTPSSDEFADLWWQETTHQASTPPRWCLSSAQQGNAASLAG